MALHVQHPARHLAPLGLTSIALPRVLQLDKIVPNKPDSGPTVAAPEERDKYFYADL